MASSIPFPKLSKHAGRAATQFPALRPALPPHAARPEWVRAPAVPFFADEQHRAPTRALFRGLLRALGPVRASPSPSRPIPSSSPSPSPSPLPPSRPARPPPAPPYPHTLAHVRAAWRHRRGWVSPRNTAAFLETQYALLSDLASPSAAARLTAQEDSLALAAAAKAAREADAAAAKAAAHVHPHLVGSMLYRSPFYGPMPRLRPQPLRFTMMVKARRARRERLYERRAALVDGNDAMRAELAFWRALGLQGDWDGGVGMASWHAENNKAVGAIDDEYRRQARRAGEEPSRWLVRRVKAARRRRTEVLQARARERKAREVGEGGEAGKGGAEN
ncbi:hypothetical protein Q8F55_007830 [Vanrija albida]|uniref:37S ribosomal protein S25, mitochondrial n=1 Tax=Vanrija albida TaxID=181172 RepID=A0ABR3PUM5_9TREE